MNELLTWSGKCSNFIDLRSYTDNA